MPATKTEADLAERDVRTVDKKLERLVKDLDKFTEGFSTDDLNILVKGAADDILERVEELKTFVGRKSDSLDEIIDYLREQEDKTATAISEAEDSEDSDNEDEDEEEESDSKNKREEKEDE